MISTCANFRCFVASNRFRRGPDMIRQNSWIDDFSTNTTLTGCNADWPRVAFSRKSWTAEDQRVGTRRTGLTSPAHAADGNTNRTETRNPRGEIPSWRRSPSLIVSGLNDQGRDERQDLRNTCSTRGVASLGQIHIPRAQDQT